MGPKADWPADPPTDGLKADPLLLFWDIGLKADVFECIPAAGPNAEPLPELFKIVFNWPRKSELALCKTLSCAKVLAVIETNTHSINTYIINVLADFLFDLNIFTSS